MGEKLIEYGIAEGSQVRVAIVRLIGVYGKHQDLDLETGSAIPVFIRRAIEYPQRQPFIVLGTGRETRSYCHVADVLDALLLSVEKLDEQALIGPLNIGNEERITIQQLAETIIRVSGKDIQIVNDPSWPTVVWGQALDCSRAREMLDGWQPRIGLEEGLGALYAHVQKQLAEITSATLCGYDPGSQENK
jgi:nucleoside-diphosphate-sugar epimerase